MRFIINAIRSNVLVGIISHGVGIKREMARTLKRRREHLSMRAVHVAVRTLDVRRQPVDAMPMAVWAIMCGPRPMRPDLVPVPTC